MTPQPEQVDVVHHVAAHGIREEVHAEGAIERKHAAGDGERGKSEDHQDAGDEYRPGKQRHAEQIHARRAAFDDGDEEIDAAHGRADTRDEHRPQPIVDADAGVVLGAGIGRIAGPAGGRELADDERYEHETRARRREPKAYGVHKGEGDIASADLLRHDEIDEAGEERHRHEEDHDRAVGGEDLIEMSRRQIAVIVVGDGLLAAHHGRVDEAAQQHDERDHDVHYADLLVVETRHPVEQHEAPGAEVGDQGHHRERAEHGDRRARGGNGAVERQRIDGQPTEDLHCSSFSCFRSLAVGQRGRFHRRDATWR